MTKTVRIADLLAGFSVVPKKIHQPSEIGTHLAEGTISSTKPRRPDTRDKERLRIRGGKMLQAGASPSVVAKALGISSSTAYLWRQQIEKSGMDSLAMLNRGGAARVLDDKQAEILEQELEKGPWGHGYNYDRWSLILISRLIEKTFNLDLTDKAVSRLLQQIKLDLRLANSLARNRRSMENSAAGSSKKKIGIKDTTTTVGAFPSKIDKPKKR